MGIVPHGDWKTTTFLAGRRSHGLVAPCVFDRAIDGAGFLAWVEQFVAPTLRPGDVVVMDNLAAHKVAGVREAIEVAGTEIASLPPYSPDLNSIEQVFAKLKALLRKAKARTVDALWSTIGSLLVPFEPTECSDHIVNAGYAQPNRKTLVL